MNSADKANAIMGVVIIGAILDEAHAMCSGVLVGGTEALKAYEKICRTLSTDFTKRADVIAEALKKNEQNVEQAKADAAELIRRAMNS